MSIALLATGDEIVIGDIWNSNTFSIAHTLHSQGLPVGMHMVSSDKEEEIVACINFLSKNHKVIIITGGLGPTSDDRTRFALSHFLGEKLVLQETALEHIHSRLATLKLPTHEGNTQQALFFANATLLPNPFGTALGCYYWWQEKLFVLLPGPPRECIPMFEKELLPLLQSYFQGNTILLKWRIFATPEAKMAQELDAALKNIDCQTGYRLDVPYVECKVSCEPHLVTTVKSIVDPLVTPHMISFSEKKASEELFSVIVEKRISLTIHDEATGGMLQTLLQKPETYSFLRFQERAEKSHPHFHIRGLQNYWIDQETGGFSTVFLDCTYQEKLSQEEKNLPLIGSSITATAAEWLCFRMLSLLHIYP